jgi:Putative peptidoglycan binding domain
VLVSAGAVGVALLIAAIFLVKNLIEFQSLRFFEAGANLPDVAQRQYTSRFPKSTTRLVHFQVEVKNRLSEIKEHPHKVLGRYYTPDGHLLREIEGEWVIKPEWKGSRYSQGWGWQEAGHWPLGLYRVEVILDGKPLAEGQFTIFEDRQEAKVANRQGSPNQRELVRQAQKRLLAAGCDSGPMDGNLGPRAQEALRCYQQGHGLSMTGTLDEATRKALGLP